MEMQLQELEKHKADFEDFHYQLRFSCIFELVLSAECVLLPL